MRRTFACGAVLLGACLLSACDKKTWVDFPMAICEEIPQLKTHDNGVALARNVCSNAGKAYTGEIRCENKAVQVLCKG